ncbi:dihydrodipicolinate synthase family protein [Pelagibacteraceae bacterium]|nr:dihydrodipicolinate synthase family protein [Pelagibacteraceae bacterium]|tara:strand:+ start:642 stop:1526 length:885 start_codon:yes stop_codon:yes gene_type:complete
MIKKGVYAAGLSILNEDLSLNVEATIAHANHLISSGLHGVFFFGSTGQSQLISLSEKKNLISKIGSHKLKKQFFVGTGSNSLKENINLIKYAMEYEFRDFLIMPPAYYKGNTDEGVFNFYSLIISAAPKIKIVLYNFEKLSGYKFSADIVKKLVKTFPNNIIGCKDSSYNLFENLKLPNFLMFPGSEAKLLKGLELGCSGCISAVTNVTHVLSRKVFDDFENKSSQTANDKLIEVRETFDNYNLISALHSYLSVKDKEFENLLPPLILLSQDKKKELITKLDNLKFRAEKNLAA